MVENITPRVTSSRECQSQVVHPPSDCVVEHPFLPPCQLVMIPYTSFIMNLSTPSLDSSYNSRPSGGESSVGFPPSHLDKLSVRLPLSIYSSPYFLLLRNLSSTHSPLISHICLPSLLPSTSNSKKSIEMYI